MNPKTACPRCGYDLSGVIQTWDDRCDVEGVCQECGLAFHWASLLGEFLPPTWHIEHPLSTLVRGLLGTLFRSFFPKRFWGSVSLERLRDVKQAVWFAVCGLMLVWAGGCIARGVSVGVPSGISNHTRYVIYSGRYPQFPPPGFGLATSIVAAEIVEAAVPFGSARGDYDWWSGDRMNFDPANLGVAIPSERTPCLVAAAIIPFVPLVYLLLPTTLGRCRVRLTQLGRGLLYALPLGYLSLEVLAMLSVGATFLCDVLPIGFRPRRITRAMETGLPWPLVVVGVQFCWWWAFNRLYLRLPSALSVTLTMIVASCLVAAIVMLNMPSFFSSLRWVAVG